MNISDLLTWLNTAPQLAGQQLSYSYLPSYSGWSLSVPKSETKTDILGNSRSVLQLKITRRCTVQSNADRLAILDALEDLADWAQQNPPPGARLCVSGLPEFTSRNNSGTEDLSVTLTLTEQ